MKHKINHRLGIDLGGTKIEAILLDQCGLELARQRISTPQHDYPATLASIAGLVRDLESAHGCRASVGIAMPGAISLKSGLVKNANSTWLNRQPFKDDLETALARPVRLENDANCLAVSEATDGAAAGIRGVFAVILGTGVGGGLAFNARCWTGHNAIAGEWGHNPLPGEHGEVPLCWCGRSGCIETLLSGPALERDHHKATGETLAAAEIAARAQAGDAPSAATLDRYCDRLARALGTVINLLDPDVIVVGGGVSNISQLYQEVPGRWNAYIFSDHVATPLVPAQHGDSSGVRGAAWLWPEEDLESA